MGKEISEMSPEILRSRNMHFAANLSPTILKEYKIMADEKDSTVEVPAEEAGVPEEAIPEGCNCKDEFITLPCPVHGAVKEEPAGFVEDIVIITDANINGEQPYGRYEGHIFICPKCKMPAIMVNQNMGEYCVKCGVKVRVQSKMVTDHIRSLDKE